MSLPLAVIVVIAQLALTTLASWAIAAWVCRHAGALGLVQIPNHRSSHVQPTPNGGGAGMVVAASLSGWGLALYAGWGSGGAVLGLAALLAVVGLRDDRAPLPVRVRLGVQVVVCAGLLCTLGVLPGQMPGAGLAGLAGWFGLAGLTGLSADWLLPGLSLLLLLLTLLAGVWWINLYNFMDGIDALAATQAICMLLAGAALAAWVQPAAVTSPAWLLMLVVAAATAGFLLLNWPPARIFMGDVGSTWLAFMVWALALLTVQAGWLNVAAWLVLAAVFVTDATTTLITRVLRGERWYEAHRSHAYQRLSRRWPGGRKAGHRTVTLLAATVNLLWLTPWAWACLQWPAGAAACVLAAYAPLILAARRLGAGRPDESV